MKFTKMHGLGNDYVYVNCFEERVPDPVALARAVSDRHCGIGSDGLILICPSDRADVRMEMYNADGSRAQMCGNGIRCVAKYAFENGLLRRDRAVLNQAAAELTASWHARLGPSAADRIIPIEVETDAGVRALAALVDPRDNTVASVRVDMGPVSLRPGDLPCTLDGEQIVDRPVEMAGRSYRITCVSLGNPHAVIFVNDLANVDLAADAPPIETAPIFPERINVHFVRVERPDRLRMVSWERGSGATQACGTGACAAAVAAVLAGGAAHDLVVELPGGELEVSWQSNPPRRVHMTGPAVEVFTGDWPGS